MVQDDIAKNFREHSIAEFFKKNKQMLGFSGKVRSMTTIVHELVTNSMDAAEENGILPEIIVKIEELDKDYYRVFVEDNGPGLPKTLIGKALGQMLAGTKFHRYIQQRGQQGIGCSACTMYALLTTGKTVHAISYYKGKKVECDVGINFKNNRAELIDLTEEDCDQEKHGLTYIGEFKEVRYERSNYGVYEYLRRTALANPHIKLELTEPNGEFVLFPRSVDQNPHHPKEVQPHPLGIGAHDLLDMAKREKDSTKISSFLQNALTRVSANKIKELEAIVSDLDFNKNPMELSWEEAEKLVKAFKEVKWIAPATDSIVPIGKEQVEKSFQNIFNPEFLIVTERNPKIYQGGIAFAVEAAIAFGGGVQESGKKGEVMRFANRVPLLFDSGGCAITETVKSVDWKRYNLKDFEEEPIVVLVNLVSVYVPYTTAGKQAISQEEEIMDEIKNTVMESARKIQVHISGKRRAHEIAHKKKLIERYVEQLANDLASLSETKNEKGIKEKLMKIVEEKYTSNLTNEDDEEENQENEPEQEEIGEDNE